MRRKERKTFNITKTQVKPNAIKAHQRNQTPVCTHRRIYHGWIPNVFLLACIQPTCSWSPFLPLLSSARRAGGRPHPPLQAEAIQEGQELRYMQAGHHQGGTHLQRWVSGKFDPPPLAGSSTPSLSRREIKMSDLWMREWFIHHNVLLVPVQDGWRGWRLSQHALGYSEVITEIFTEVSMLTS